MDEFKRYWEQKAVYLLENERENEIRKVYIEQIKLMQDALTQAREEIERLSTEAAHGREAMEMCRWINHRYPAILTMAILALKPDVQK